MVAIGRASGSRSRQASAAPEKNRKYKNEDLPVGCIDGNRWRGCFIPSYIWFLAFQDDPWRVSDNAAVKGMQKIWDAIYNERIPYEISANDAVFTIVRVSRFLKFILTS
jgi:hypothetical protein